VCCASKAAAKSSNAPGKIEHWRVVNESLTPKPRHPFGVCQRH